MKTIVENPQLYDLLYENVTEDINMYKKLLKDKKRILEFGAGTGRVTIPLAYDNHHIVAVDLSKKMLNGLSNKIKDIKILNENIIPTFGNMCGYNDSNTYDAVIVPLTSFNYLLSKQEQIACLNSIKNALNDKGIAIVELLSNQTFIDTNQSDEYTFIKNIFVSDNEYYKYYTITKLDMESRVITQKRLFEKYINDKFISKEEYIWNNRFITIEDFTELVNVVGLDIEKIYGNCNLESYNENSEDVFVRLKRRNK